MSMQGSGSIGAKISEAGEVVRKCLGRKGVWASPVRYRDQCWTRDLVIAAEDLLIESGETAAVETHLSQLAKRQRPDGRIPIMYLDNAPRWILGKIRNSLRERRMSFLLRRYFSPDGVGSLSPWTRDSEFLFVLGAANYAARLRADAFARRMAPRIRRALAYVEGTLMQDGLVHGADWRDTRPDLDDKFLLSNNCLLCRAYSLIGEAAKAEALRSRINERFWTGCFYRDHPGTDGYDTLGNALAILFDIAPSERWESVLTEAERLNTPAGFVLNSVTLPPKNKQEAELMQRVNQHGVVWPFIHGFMILAMVKAGQNDRARREFAKYAALPGFFEWYDPLTLRGCGSPDQLWSAALFLRAARALGYV